MKKSRKLKYRSISVATTVIFIAVIILLNVIAGMLTDRFSLKIDITGINLFELSDETVEMLHNMDEEVTANVLSEQSTYEQTNMTINEILLRYQTASNGKFKINYVDTLRNPDFVRNYDILEDLYPGSIIFESEKRYDVVSPYDLVSETTASIDLYAEQAFTTAINFVIRDDLPKALMIEGHNEIVSAGFQDILINNNFEVASVNLLNNDIPEDTELVVIGSPQVDYSGDEIDKLDKFLRNYGRVIIFAGPYALELPALERYLEEWGMDLGTDLVIEPERYSGYPSYILPQLTASELNYEVADQADTYLFAPNCRSISSLWEGNTRSYRSVEPVLVTTQNAYTKNLLQDTEAETSWEKEDGDLSGEFTVAMFAKHEQIVNSEVYSARILVIGSDSFAADDILAQPNILNKAWLTSAVGYVCDLEDIIAISPKDVGAQMLIISADQARIILIALVAVLPILVFLIGFFQWRRRRNM